MWKANNLKAMIDISTYCNAACPQCHRTNKNGLGKADWLPLIQWSLEDVKKAFPPQHLLAYNRFQICGTWGDPAMNKDIVPICEYLLSSEVNEQIEITLNTNGSMRSEEFWWDLGLRCGNRLNVYFTIDGINQEMHSKYRRGTNLERILTHMEIVSQTKARAHAFVVLFKHNQDYVEELKELAKEYGAETITFVKSDRFENGQPDYFIDENGNTDYFEQSTLDVNDWEAIWL